MDLSTSDGTRQGCSPRGRVLQVDAWKLPRHPGAVAPRQQPTREVGLATWVGESACRRPPHQRSVGMTSSAANSPALTCYSRATGLGRRLSSLVGQLAHGRGDRLQRLSGAVTAAVAKGPLD